jgi:cobalt-zinc-cadmium efflux system protein
LPSEARLGAKEGDVVPRRLALVLGLTLAFTVAEAVGGWLSNSLALLADATHMLTDVAALALALVAAWSSRRPPSARRTFGYRRAEILAALLNGVALIVLAVFIFGEAWSRLREPPEVEWGLMSAVAAGGFLVNVASAWILRPHRHGFNVRAAYLHVLGDLVGSIGVLAAAGLMAWRGWLWADPVFSAGIGLIVVVSAVRLVIEAIDVLMEGAPAHLDARAIHETLRGLDGVSGVHDLHLWSVAGDRPLLTAHLELDHSLPPATVLRRATELMRERFDITHVTLQPEPPDFNIVQGL